MYGCVSRQDMGPGGVGGQTRLVLGPFTVSPAFGFILPGGQQVITVECIAETPDKFDEVRWSFQNPEIN